MVGEIKVMVTSFKMTSAHTVVFSAPDPTTGHCQPMSLPEIPGHSWISLAQSLVGSLLLSPVSCVYKVFFEPSKSLFPQTC